MSETLTVYQIVHSGKTMNECQDRINDILEESGLSVLNKIALLDLMAFDLKRKAI